VHARVGGVEHKVQQLGLAGHVGIQLHRHHAERLGHPAHRHRVQALGIGELGGRVHHGVDAQPLPGAVPRDGGRVAPQQLQGPGRVAMRWPSPTRTRWRTPRVPKTYATRRYS
jgi:hypothetical protein